jgi:succinoglycan biosynthesis protein ExoV
MKLFYYRFPKERFPQGLDNFGDDLNPWLWEKLLPDILDDDERVAFVGIGTLLNKWLPNRVPNAKKIVVFGSGAGYGDSPPVDDSWKIYCLRGPLSAQALGVSSDLAVTDGAVLVRRVFQATAPKRYKFAYMPHVMQAVSGQESWKLTCEQAQFGYIDPRGTTDEVLHAISQTEVLLTEAMHGAIVADALRVPWIPICTTKSVLSFKWQDWCASVGVEYQPIALTYLSDPKEKKSLTSSIRNWLKTKRVASELKHIAKQSSPCLSQEADLERLTVRLEEKLHAFKADWERGCFSSELFLR